MSKRKTSEIDAAEHFRSDGGSNQHEATFCQVFVSAFAGD